MFKPQEIHDANTGVHIATGQHVNGTAWLRISLGPKTTTAFFNGAGDVTKLVPHNAPPPVGGPGEEKMTFAEVMAREDATKQEQVEHVDEISKAESTRPHDVDARGEVRGDHDKAPEMAIAAGTPGATFEAWKREQELAGRRVDPITPAP